MEPARPPHRTRHHRVDHRRCPPDATHSTSYEDNAGHDASIATHVRRSPRTQRHDRRFQQDPMLGDRRTADGGNIAPQLRLVPGIHRDPRASKLNQIAWRAHAERSANSRASATTSPCARAARRLASSVSSPRNAGQGHDVGAQCRDTAVRARAFTGQRPIRVVDQEFPHSDPLARQPAPQRILVPAKVRDVYGGSLTMRQRFRRRGGLHVAASEIRYEQDQVPFDSAPGAVPERGSRSLECGRPHAIIETPRQVAPRTRPVPPRPERRHTPRARPDRSPRQHPRPARQPRSQFERHGSRTWHSRR